MNNKRKEVYDALEKMNITYTTIEHRPVYTMEEIDKLGIDSKNEIVKNLFVRDDKKKRYFLIVLKKDKQVNLKEIRNKLNCRPLSFASEADLSKYMVLNKGEVTPFGVLHDDELKVEVVLDSDILLFSHVGVHPNDNTATVFISPSDLENIISYHGNKISYIDI